MSNGIAPYDRCPDHYAAYKARLARHDLIKDLVERAMAVDAIARAFILQLAAEEGVCVDEDEELVGWVMDLICADFASDRDVATARSSHNWMPYIRCAAVGGDAA